MGREAWVAPGREAWAVQGREAWATLYPRPT